MNVRKYTEEYRQQLVEEGRDLFTFCRGLLGMSDLTPELHWDMCQFLQGRPPYEPWIRALVCMFRGSLKSSIGTIGFGLHRGLYEINHATKLVEQKEDNAYRNHFQPMVALFRESRQADFLQWVYQDRLPENFAGWNAHQIVFNRTDPLAPPAITYAGLSSALEGWHGNLVLIDDPEGADEETALVPNEAAWRMVVQRAVPLLREPNRDQILMIGTPHGDRPTVWRIRDAEHEVKKKTGKSIFAIYWKEIVDSSNRSRWPERFDEQTIRTLKVDRELWEKQYMLKRMRSGAQTFDMDLIRANCWEWAGGHQLLSYVADEVSPFELDEQGYPLVKKVPRTVALSSLRPYMHCDPKHRDRREQRAESEAAIVIVGVHSDGHAFVLDTWSDDVGLEEFAEKVYWYYRKWQPLKVTMEAVGAQTWFWSYARILERTKYRQIVSLPRRGASRVLPRLSVRLEEAVKKNQAKETWIIDQLSSWLNTGLLHLHRSQEHLMAQIEVFPEEGRLRDLIDALSDGPPVWRTPMSQKLVEEYRDYAKLTAVVGADPVTGYLRPWGEPN